MRWSIILLLIAFTGCQAPEDGADPRIAFIESDPLAGFVSDDPCGWDDPGVFHTDAANLSRFYAVDDGGADFDFTEFSVFSDGTARVAWQISGVDVEVLDAEWTRAENSCLISISAPSFNGELIALGNPSVGPCLGVSTADVVRSAIPNFSSGWRGFSVSNGCD